jgi:hypothetical protein
VIITNDHDLSVKALIAHYARRMTIEQRLAEIIQAFHADALSSAVNLNVNLDIMLCVLAQALTAALRNRLPGYHSVTPDVLQRRFLETPGTITTSDDTITVRLDRRAYSPVLRQADLPQDTQSLGGETEPYASNSTKTLRRISCVEIRVRDRDQWVALVHIRVSSMARTPVAPSGSLTSAAACGPSTKATVAASSATVGSRSSDFR